MTFIEQLRAYLADPSTWSGPSSIPTRIGEHVWLSALSVTCTALIMIPFGLWLGHIRRGAVVAAAVVNIGRAIPSLGILAIGLIIAVNIGLGLGAWPAFMALVALAAPPIFTNTVTGIQSVEPAIVESARGMGFTEFQLLRRIEVPLAMPLIMEGLRIALVQVIATATLAALVAWGGLGRLIVDGFAKQRGDGELFVGAVLVAVLALIAESSLGRLQKAATPPGLG